MGSIAYTERYEFAQTPEYKISKAAMNMLTAQYAMEYRAAGFTFLAISPGVCFTIHSCVCIAHFRLQWVKTDLGSEAADLDIVTAVEALLRTIVESDASMNGKFLNIKVSGWEKAQGPNQYDGAEIPW